MTDSGPRLRRQFLLLALILAVGLAQGRPVRLVTFGPEATPGKGDDDFTEEVYLKIPRGAPSPLYVHVYDPDTGGAEDEPNGRWNTRTRFALFGGDGAARRTEPSGSGHGDLLAEAVFGEDAEADGRWTLLAEIRPPQGAAVANSQVFRVRVEGITGDDGNLYDVAVSSHAEEVRSVEGIQVLNERPTISIPPMPGRVAEVRLEIPAGTRQVDVRSFDLDWARAALEMPFVDPTPLTSSGDGRWAEDRIQMPADASARAAAVVIQGGRTLLNDLVLEARDQDDRPLAFRLPIRMFPPNVAPQPRIRYSLEDDCRSVTFDASASDGVDHALQGYRWRFGDGTEGTGVGVRHRYGETGTYPVTLTVTDDSDRVVDRARTQVSVKINRLPEPVPGPPRTLAPGEQGHFDASESHDSDGRILAYRWDFGDGSTARGARVSHVYAEPGRYKVVLSIDDDGPGPCSQAEADSQVWVNAAPLPEAGPDQVVAVGEPIRLDAGASRDPDGRLRDYAWELGDGGSAQGEIVEYTYQQPGRYEVVLTVTDDAGVSNSQAQDRLEVWVNDPPVAQIAAPDRGAAGELLTFDASASRDPDGELTQVLWDFGDGSEATGAEVAHRYAAPGDYVVRLTVLDDSGTRSAASEASATIAINHPPVAEAGPDRWVTASEVSFDGTGSRDPDGQIESWRWDFGDGTTGSGPTPVHVYSAPGVYQVRLRVTDDSSTRSATTQDGLQVRVNAKPVADAGPDRLGVPGAALRFDGSRSFDPDGGITEYLWDFGDGETATGRVVTHRYRAPGRYDVGLEVRDDSGHAAAVGSADALVHINAAPVARAGPDWRVAPGDPVQLDGTASYDPDGAIRAYTWTIGNGSEVPTGPEQELRFERPGILPAELQVVDDSGAPNGIAQDAVSIHVNHPPSAVLTERIDQCDMRVALDGGDSRDPDGDRLRYTWDFGDGSPPGRGARPLHRFGKPGRYPVTLSVDDGTGLANATDSAVAEVRLHRPPTAVAEAPGLVCAGDVVLFNGARSRDPDGGQLLHDWDFGDDSTAQGVSPSKRYRDGGHYAVTLRVQDDSGLPCDQGLDRIGVTVVDAPVAVAGDDRRACAGQPITFDGTASRDYDGVVNRYQWDFGDGSEGGGAQPTHLYGGAGEYRVKLTVTGDQIGDCHNRNTDELVVEVLEAPPVELQAPDAIPLGAEVTLRAVASTVEQDALASGLVLRWDFGDGEQGEGASATHRYRAPGRYQVTLTADDGSGGACSRTQRRHSLLVNAPPEAAAGADRTAAVGERLVFDASASTDPDGVLRSYHWDMGDGTSKKGVRVSHIYRYSGDHSVTLTVADGSGLENAAQSDHLLVRVNAPPVADIAVRPEVPCPGEDVEFDASASHDPDGHLTAWSWDFGDGEQTEGVHASHRYAEPGRYGLRLDLSDDSEASNATLRTTRDLRVNAAPIAEVLQPLTGCPEQPIRFDASRSHDPDGRITGYAWRFGDGTAGAGAAVSHAYAQPGRYPVELRVTDDSGSACASARASTEAVVNARPAARARASSEIVYRDGAHEAIQFDASPSGDPDGDPLVYHWDFGDQTQGRGPRVAHRFSEPGRYLVTLTATDDSGTACAEATATLRIDVKAARDRNPSERP